MLLQSRIYTQEPPLLLTQEFVKSQEGPRPTACLCPGGHKAIGWGHAIGPCDGLDIGNVAITIFCAVISFWLGYRAFKRK